MNITFYGQKRYLTGRVNYVSDNGVLIFFKFDYNIII